MNNAYFVCGSYFFIKNFLLTIKNSKSFDLEESNFNEILYYSCSLSILNEPQIVLINKFPNNKKERDFSKSLIENIKNSQNILYFIDFDGKTKYSDKGPEHDFASNYNNWIVLENDFNEKNEQSSINWIKKQFKNKNIEISEDAAKLFFDKTGKKKEMTIKEIDKLVILGLKFISAQDIHKYTSPLKKEQILYKFSSAMDGGIEDALVLLEEFLNSNVHANLINEMLLKRARWNVFIADCLIKNFNFFQIKSKVMNKANQWDKMESIEESQKSFKRFFSKVTINELEKFNTGESVSSPFIADLIIKSFNSRYFNFMDNKIVLFEKILNDYLEILKMSSLIRYNWDLNRVYLVHMVKILCS